MRGAAAVDGPQTAPLKSEPSLSMTLGGVTKAGVRMIVWCRSCSRQVEPDPGELAARYGAGIPVLEWMSRLVCSGCGSRDVDMVLTRQHR